MFDFIKKISSRFHILADKYFTDLKLQKRIFYIILLCVFCLMLAFNLLYPRTSDDILYTYIYKDPNLGEAMKLGLEPIENIHDLYTSLSRHYLEWSGRLTAHFFLQVFLNIGSGLTVIKVINSLMCTFLIFLMYKISSPPRQYKPGLLLLMIMMLWAFNPSFEETMLWLPGSCVYLWMEVLVLLLLIPAKKYIFENKQYTKKGFALAMFLLGIIAGNSSENTAVGVTFIMILCLIYMKYKSIRIPRWYVSAFIGEIVGAVILIAAPGNYARIAASDFSSTADFSTFYLYISRINNTTICFIDFMLPLLICLTVLFIIISYSSLRDKNKIIIPAIMFSACALITAYCMTVSPSFPFRAWFTVVVFLIIAVGILYNGLNRADKLIYTVTFFVILLCVLPLFLSVRDMYIYVKSGDVFMITYGL